MSPDKAKHLLSKSPVGGNNFNYAKIGFNLEKRKYLCHKINNINALRFTYN